MKLEQEISVIAILSRSESKVWTLKLRATYAKLLRLADGALTEIQKCWYYWEKGINIYALLIISNIFSKERKTKMRKRYEAVEEV